MKKSENYRDRLAGAQDGLDVVRHISQGIGVKSSMRAPVYGTKYQAPCNTYIKLRGTGVIRHQAAARYPPVPPKFAKRISPYGDLEERRSEWERLLAKVDSGGELQPLKNLINWWLECWHQFEGTGKIRSRPS